MQQALEVLETAGKNVAAETKAEVKKEAAPTRKTDASSSEKGFFGWIANSLAPKLNKITGNIYISAIQQSIMSILPMIMIGSVASIVGVLEALCSAELAAGYLHAEYIFLWTDCHFPGSIASA